MNTNVPTALSGPTKRETVGKPKQQVARAAALLLCGATLLTPAQALEDYAFWDKFDGVAQINPALWLGMERSRMIEGGMLRMIQRDLGSQHNNTEQYSSVWSTYLQNPDAIKQLRATVTVNDFAVSGCTANTTPSVVQAGLSARFFNAGPGVPASEVNDIVASIRFKRYSNSADAAGLLRVQGTISQCAAADCKYGTITLGSVDLGIATVGQAAILKLEWDPANKRFNFYRDSNPVQRVTYTASDAQAPYISYRKIDTGIYLANCMTGPRTEGFMDAKIDKVYVNASAITP